MRFFAICLIWFSLSSFGKEDKLNDVEIRIDSILTFSNNYNDHLEIMKLIRWKSYIFNDFISIPPVKPPGYSFRVTSTYGYRVHPIHQKKHIHSGIDLPVMNGNDTVYAPANGVVDSIAYNDHLGYYVILTHKYRYKTIFGHLSKVLIFPKENIKQGFPIAIMGNTGTSTNIHLHYTIKHNGQYVDPLKYSYIYFDFFLKYPQTKTDTLKPNISNQIQQP